MLVLNCLVDPRFGGPQRASLAVAQELQAEGVDTEFLIPDGSVEFAKKARKHGFTVHQVRICRIHPPRQIASNLKFGARFPGDVWKVHQLIKSRGIDVVNARMSLSLHAALAARLSQTPVVWHFNDTVVPEPLAKVIGAVGEYLANELVVSANNVSEYYFSQKERSTKIYPIVDVEKFHPASTDGTAFRNGLVVPDEARILGLVGNVNPLKGYETFVDAFASISNTHDDVHAVIAGLKLKTQEEYYESLQSQISQYGVCDRIHFLGWVENIKGFLAATDLFVMPSYSETGPMTLLEAMALGKPSITTNVGVVPEQLTNKKEGWIVPAGDSHAMAEALDDALSNVDDWAEFGRKARKCAVANFSLDNAANKYLEVYRSALRD